MAFGITTTSFGLEDGAVAAAHGCRQLAVTAAPNGMDVTGLDGCYRRRGFRNEQRRVLRRPLLAG